MEDFMNVGMSLKVFEDFPVFNSKSGEEFRLVKFVKDKWLLCWQVRRASSGVYESTCQPFNIMDVEGGKETLEELKVWDLLPKKSQQYLLEHETQKLSHIHEKMSKAREKRQPKYPNIPREIECSQCHKSIKIPPGITAGKIEKANVPIEAYVKAFKCQVCVPSKRGRPKKTV